MRGKEKQTAEFFVEVFMAHFGSKTRPGEAVGGFETHPLDNKKGNHFEQIERARAGVRPVVVAVERHRNLPAPALDRQIRNSRAKWDRSEKKNSQNEPLGFGVDPQNCKAALQPSYREDSLSKDWREKDWILLPKIHLGLQTLEH